MLFWLPDGESITEQDAVLKLISARDMNISKASKVVALIVRYTQEGIVTEQEASRVLNLLIYGPPIKLSSSTAPSKEHEDLMLPIIKGVMQLLERK